VEGEKGEAIKRFGGEGRGRVTVGGRRDLCESVYGCPECPGGVRRAQVDEGVTKVRGEEGERGVGGRR
jgi:hypothetical protein